jgi:chemotaxis protein methyltransferase CheR
VSECPPRGACAIANLISFAAVRDLIEERCGLRFDDSQRASLSASVSTRMQQLGLVSEDEYVDRLRGAAPRMMEAELRNLLNLVTVTETCFFRDASQFRMLREHIIPTLVSERSARRDKSRTIRIWSAGCSSGEEAFSIALALEDMGFYRACPDWKVEIVGTDLNTKMLEKARAGVYTARAVRNVEGRLLDRYFQSDERTFALTDAIKERVKFEFGNLTQTPMPSTGPQDIVFCKNVTIYFSVDVTRRLIQGLHGTLAPDGFLLLGHAESLWQMSAGFVLVEHAGAFCYRKSSHVARSGVAAVEPKRPAKRSAAARIRPASPKLDLIRRATADKPEPDARTSDDYNLCLAAFRAGDWDAAEAGVSALVASYPTFVPALLLLGGLYAHRGRFDEALRQAESVLKLSDLEPRAHLLLGMIEARRDRTDEALLSLRRALYLDDSLALAHFWLGNLYRDRGDLARACQEYENVVRDWERKTLELTEEFASDLSAEQLVGFCSDSLERLRAVNVRERLTVNGKR